MACPDSTGGCGAFCTASSWDSLTSSGFTAGQATALCQTVLADAGAATATMTMGSGYLTAANSPVIALQEGLNCFFLVSLSSLVFIMHGGFAMLCAGAIRSKNTMNILLQTMLDACGSAIAFYLIGFGIAFGGYTPAAPLVTQRTAPNGFIGTGMFALSGFNTKNPNNFVDPATGIPISTHWQDFLYQWAFAATAATIPAGAVAERFNFNAYLGYSFFISAWVYPVVVHWAWSLYGWMGYGRAGGLPHLFGAGYIDFAGSGVVHMVGGISGMWGCILVGPRLGRFTVDGKPNDMPGHSATLVVLGTVLLWFGWYGFNPGSTITINSINLAMSSGRAAVTTTMAGAAGGLAGLTNAFLRNKAWDLLAVCNGVLCGFVAVTAGAHVLEPWAAILCGALSCLVFDGVSALFLRACIDDPLGAAPMHGFTGMWGLFFVGLLAKQEYVYQVYAGTHLESGCAYGQLTVDPNDASSAPCDNIDNYPYGLLYPGGGGRLLACQLVGIVVIFCWVSGNMLPFFYAFKLAGMLRSSVEEEAAGLDVSKHGGSAYNFDSELPSHVNLNAERFNDNTTRASSTSPLPADKTASTAPARVESMRHQPSATALVHFATTAPAQAPARNAVAPAPDPDRVMAFEDFNPKAAAVVLDDA